MAEAAIAQNFFERHRTKIAFAGADQCWLWTAGKRNGNGYGAVWIRGRTRTAHREAFEAIHGPGSADGLVVRHKCDVRACVNPAHLEIGTQADNVRDRDQRGRRLAPQGEAHGAAKLSEADVRAIRADYVRRSEEFGQSALARRYGVGQSLISDVIKRQRWAHI